MGFTISARGGGSNLTITVSIAVWPRSSVTVSLYMCNTVGSPGPAEVSVTVGWAMAASLRFAVSPADPPVRVQA